MTTPHPDHRTERILLSVTQVASRLGVSGMTVRRMIHAGTLPAIRVGGLYRISQHDLDAYLNRQATRAEAHRP